MVDIIDSLVNAFATAMPLIVVAIIFIIAGIVIGILIKFLIVKIFKKMGIDEWFEEHNLLSAMGNRSFSSIVGKIAKWYIFFVFVKQAVEIVNLVTLNAVLGFWIQYALLVIAAIGVIIAGLIIGRFARNAVEATDYSLKRLFGLMLEIMVVYIAVVMGISLIGLPTTLLEMAFIIVLAGVVFAVSLMIGLGFGLALKDEAKDIIKELKKGNKK